MRSAFVAGVVLAYLLCGTAAAAEKYKPTWKSIDARPMPAWFNEAKFGIFIHWGVYSVPSWSPKGTYAEWYWHAMQDKNGPTWKHHVETYDEDFAYQDFAPMFKAELFDPAQWADMFKRSGAKYVVLTSKHHEGFCLWPSPDSWNWNAADVGPHRDLLGDLTEAVRAAGLRMGFYYSFYEWFNPLYKADVHRYVAEHMLPQLKDLVVRYKPSIVWPDGEWDHPSDTWRSAEFLAWLYNESPVKDEVVVDDRWGKDSRGVHGDFYTSEYGGYGATKPGLSHPWEEDRGMGASFGYNRNESIDEYGSAVELIRTLVRAAGLGGNLLLDIGPTADGRIPVIMQERLVQIGEWLIPNGESIYGTTGGPFRRLPWGGCTRKPGRLYFHVFDWPQGALEIPGLRNEVKKAYLLRDTEQKPLPVARAAHSVTIELPDQPPYAIATVVVAEIAGEPDVDLRVHQGADGAFLLSAAAAAIEGNGPRYEESKDCIGYWKSRQAFPSWTLAAETPGTFDIEITYACPQHTANVPYVVTVAGQRLQANTEATAGWEDFAARKIGQVQLSRPGDCTLTVQAAKLPPEGLMNLRAVMLRPAR
jgi:alpha-L-fucosidase